MALKNVIKEYLVSLGFNINKNSLSDALELVDLGSQKINSLTSSMSSNLAKGSLGIISMTAAAVVSVGKLVSSVADADMATQNAANSMWMNVDAYRVTQDAVESLGYSMNELSTIARNPELTNQFKELVTLGQQTAAPKELDTMLKKVRSVSFEFDKMKVIAKNGIRQIVYYFMKYMGTDIDKAKDKLSAINSFLIENLPKIAAAIAKVLYYIYRVGKAVGYVFSIVSKLITGIYNFMKKFPSTFKVFIGIIAAIFLTLNPVLTLIFAGLSAIVLLIDDYMTWKRGGKSFFGDNWAEVEDVLGTASDVLEWIFEKIEWAVNYIINNLKPFFEWFYKIFEEIFGWLKEIFDWFDEKMPEIKKGTDALGITNPEDPESESIFSIIKNASLASNPIFSNLKFGNFLKNLLFDENSYQNTTLRALLGDRQAKNVLNNYNQNITVNGNMDEKSANKVNQYSENALKSLGSASVTR